MEYAAMTRGSTVLTSGLAQAEISGALDDFEQPLDTAVTQQWQQRDLEIEDGMNYVQSELERRSLLLGGAYPFDLSATSLTYKGATPDLLYEFCLAICCAPNVTTGRYAELPRVFERVVSLVVEMFLGDGSESLHVGTPRDAAVGTLFREAMEKLHAMTSEFLWSPEDVDLAKAPPTTGDEGVDFIAWKKPGDARPGRLFILGQCACGNTIEDKYDDCNYEKFRKWFRPAAAFGPVRALATPMHLADVNLREAQREAGLVLDRARLALIAEAARGRALLRPFEDRMRDLIDVVVAA